MNILINTVEKEFSIMYKLNKTSITRLSDSASIPFAVGNTDYDAYLVWLSEGNTPEPYIEPVPTYQELRASAYPPAADFADAYYWAQKGNLALMEAYIDECLAVKAKYPKWTI